MNRNNSVLGGIACFGSGCLTCVLLLAVIVAYRYSRNSPRAEFNRHNMTGNDFYKAGAYKRAVIEYTGMIDAMPHNWMGYLFRSMAYYKMGAYDKAIADNTAVLRMNVPAQVIADAHYNRGLDYENKRDNRHAIADFSVVIRMNPGNTDALINRADSRRLLGDLNGCVSDITTSIRLKRQTYGEYLIRGLAYVDLHQYANAASDLGISTSMDPSDSMKWGNLAWAQYMLGNLSAATTNGNKAVERAPAVAMYRFNLAISYAVQNDWQHAREQYTAGCVHASQADFKGALQDINDAQAKYSSASATLLRASTLLKEAKSPQAGSHK